MTSTADVFLSYSREDQPVARLFAEGLEKAGFNVWWDQTLRSGEAYDEVTEQALRSAKAVVVLWSKASIASRWVRAEATIADRNRTLLPAMIEVCDRPVMFELTQTAELVGWKGESGDRRWLAFVDDIRRKLGQPAKAPVATPPQREGRARRGAITIPIVAVALTAVLVAGWMYLRSARAPSAAPAAVLKSASVAVLPFANLTGDAGKEYFGDGMAEELINALAKVPGLKVASRTSSFAYKGRNADVRQIASDLNVASVLEGSVRAAGDRVRITAQLINAESGYHLWSETYDSDFKDIFALQDDLARKIVAAFRKSTNAPLDFKSQGPPTRDVQAYNLYLQGLALMTRNSDEEILRGIKLLEEAVGRDPQFGQAYLVLAVLRGSVNQSAADIERDARRAMEITPALAPAARTLLAMVEAKRRHWVEAEDLLQGVTVEASLAYDFYALPLVTRWSTGQLGKVIRDYEEAVRLAPAQGAFALNLALAYLAAGRTDDAARLRNTMLLQGVNAGARRALQLSAGIAAGQGRYDDAAADLIKALPDRVRSAGGAEAVQALFSSIRDPARRAGAISAVRELETGLRPEEWIVKVFMMAWYSQLARPDLSLATGEALRVQFGEEQSTNAWAWLWSPNMQETRRSPGFNAFVTRLGMIPYWEKYGPPDGCKLESRRLTCS